MKTRRYMTVAAIMALACMLFSSSCTYRTYGPDGPYRSGYYNAPPKKHKKHKKPKPPKPPKKHKKHHHDD